MSENEQNVPPVGEEIHLPGGSLQPLMLTIGTTLALLGLTFNWFVCGFGVIMVIVTLYMWIQDTRKEIESFPADLGHH